MPTMTALEAENHFGEMSGAAQREPAPITQRALPVSSAIPPQDDNKEALLRFMKTMSELAPLSGPEASGALTRFFAENDRDQAAQHLTEADVARMIHEPE